MSGLLSAAAMAGAITTILGCIAILGRLLRRIPIVDRFHHWIAEGWRRDREERVVAVLKEHLPEMLDEALAFNGTGRFRSDMRHFYKQVNDFMARQVER